MFALAPLRRPLKTQTLVASSQRSSSSNSGAIVINDFDLSNLLLELAVTQASGTSPTLDVYFQESLDGGTNFLDVAHFAQFNASSATSHYVKLSAGSSDAVVGSVGDATINASALGLSLVSNVWRVKWVVAGTGPAFTFAVNAYYA